MNDHHDPKTGEFTSGSDSTTNTAHAHTKIGGDLPKGLAEAARMDRQSQASDYQMVHVNVDKVEADWRKEKDFHIPSGDSNAKYHRVQQFMRSSPKEFNVPVMSVNERETGFVDGRHRFAVLRDAGYKRVPVSMDRASLAHARKRGYLS